MVYRINLIVSGKLDKLESNMDGFKEYAEKEGNRLSWNVAQTWASAIRRAAMTNPPTRHSRPYLAKTIHARKVKEGRYEVYSTRRPKVIAAIDRGSKPHKVRVRKIMDDWAKATGFGTGYALAKFIEKYGTKGNRFIMHGRRQGRARAKAHIERGAKRMVKALAT